jgi:hypothetical protein
LRLQRVLHHVTRIAKGDPIVTRPPVAPELDHATRRALAVGLFNYTSRYHWGEVGELVNLARGEWQVARVYCVLGRAEPALYHARRCVELNEANEAREDWELGSAYEAMARASAVAGDLAARDEWKARAAAELPKIQDDEDRQILEQDLATLPG